MSECIVVKENSGFYELVSTEPEYWPDVRHRAERVEHIEDLLGWGRWTTVYRVYGQHGEVWTYFVAE